MDGELRADLSAAVLAEMQSAAVNPVRWGTDDCVMFCANPIRKVLGYDPADWARGRYDTRDGAIETIGRMGLGYVLRRAARRHGWPNIDPAEALPGDVGLGLYRISETQSAVTTLICRAPGWFVARGDDGFVGVKSGLVRLAWCVLPQRA